MRVLSLGQMKELIRVFGIDEGELHWANSTIERAASHRERFEKIAKENGPDVEAQLASQTCEFYAIKMLLHWKQGNRPLANVVFAKATDDAMIESLSQPHVAEYMAKALFEIGNELFKQKSYPPAIQWLQRAFDVLDKVEVLYLSEHGSELRLNATHNLGMFDIEFRCRISRPDVTNSEGVHQIGHSRVLRKGREYNRHHR